MQGELGSWVFTSFAAANACYVDGVPWLEAGGLGSVVVPTGDWKHPVQPLGL